MNPSTHAASQYASTSSKLAARLAIHDWNTHSQGWFAWVADRLPQTGDVLEVGAGTGELWRHAAANPDPSTGSLQRRLVLTDFSAAMCDELRSIPGAEVQQCDAAHLPFATASFDTVIANHMLYHVDDPAAAVAELCRVLRPGGRLFVALNGLDHLQELFDIGDAIGRPSVIRQQARVTAETAEPLLAASHLADVSHERFPGAFEVAEPGPVVAYLGSVGDGPLSPEQEQVVRTAVASRIEKEGTFRVTKNMVLFSGRKE